MRQLTLACILLIASVTAVEAQNWPQFRGPGATGVVEGKPAVVKWDVPKATNVRWKTEIPGLSHASPIVWDNYIFVITAVSSDAQTGFIAKDRGIGLATDNVKHTWTIYALDKRNGKVFWTNSPYEGVPRARRHVKATQANSTPVSDGRYVVALFGSEGLACYSMKGKLLWKQDLGVLNPGLWDDKESSWGHSSSPIIYRDLVIVQADGHTQSFMAAFNLKDGKQAWRVARNEITSWATPTIYQGKDRTDLIANGGRYIRGYDPLTGKEIWRFADNETQVKMQAPLIAHDPYFSIWSTSDRLTGGPTRHWTGTPQEFSGIVRVDNQNFRYLGNAEGADRVLEEADRKLTPTRTIVTLQNAKIEMRICFLTPAFPDDLKTMSRPVTYLTWDVKSRDGAEHDVTLYLDVDGSVATNTESEAVVWSRARIPGLHLLRVGTERQTMLEQWGDNLRINWGHFYLAVPDADGNASMVAGNGEDRDRFNESGKLPESDDLDQPRVLQSRYPPQPLLNLALPLGKVGASGVSRHVLLAYDDVYSIEYMHQKLLPYWRKEFPTFTAMLEAAARDYTQMEKRAEQYDAQLEHDLVRAGGKEYAAIAILAFRQAIAAHKLVEDADGIPFFMPKENFSNGSISTVDVIYPSAPMFLFLNPKLVEAQLEPVARYAETSHWKFPFAPHDLGVYPLANGQLYGGGEISEDDQMPVEESGNMILMFAALAHAENDAAFAGRHWPLLTKWAEFLLQNDLPSEHFLIEATATDRVQHTSNPARYSLLIPRKVEGGQRTTFGGKKIEPEPPLPKKGR